MPAMGYVSTPGPIDKVLASPLGGYSKGDSRRLLGNGPCIDGSAGIKGVGDLEKAVHLLTHEDTAELTNRQLVVLNRVCKVCKRGFRYRELALAAKLLPLVERRIVSGNAFEFRAPLLKLLKLCSLAPVRDCANEESTETGLTALSIIFRQLSSTLWSTDRSIQSATAGALKKIAAGNDPTRPNTPEDEAKAVSRESLNDLRPKPRDTNQALLLGCGVVTSAVACVGVIVGSLLENLVDLDDLSLESSSFGGSESDFHAEAQLVYRGLEERGMGIARNETDVTTGGVSPCEPAAAGVKSSESVALTDQLQVAHQSTCKITAVSDMGSNYSALISLLHFVRELSTNPTCSAAMVEAGLIGLLVQVLRAVRGIRDPTLSVAVEILWNCLEHSQESMSCGSPAASRTDLIRKARKSNAAFALSTWDGVSALRDTVEALLIGGFRNKDKQLRNEAVIVASQLASNSRSHPLFRSTGMLQLLLRYATAIETGLADGDSQAAESEARTSALAADDRSSGSRTSLKVIPELGELADPRNFATAAEVDLELKLLLWPLLAELTKRDPQNLEVINASSLMEIMLMYMDLVVEEGPCSDATSTSLSRSVSLASMPPIGSTSQAGSMALENAAVFDAEVRVHHASRGSGTSADLPSAASPATGSSYSVIRSPLGSDPSAIANSADKQSEIWESEQGLSLDGVEAGPGERPITGATPLYVPTTVVRLPVTSIQLLQGQAMASLLVLAPRFPRKFQTLGGHMVTLRLLDRLGSRPENQKLVKAATKMLSTVVGLSGLKEELGRMDGVRIMLERFSAEGKRGPQRDRRSGSNASSNNGGGAGAERGRGGGRSEGGDDLRTDTVVILCRLCEGCHDNQEAFRKADGIPTMMAAIKAYCRARSEAKQHEEGHAGAGCSSGGRRGRNAGAGFGTPQVGLVGSESAKRSAGSSGGGLDPTLVHVVDCIWCAVIGNRRSEARLLQCEGLDTLLDLLELCPVVMRHQVTGLVADLLRNKRSIPYARAWRSDFNMLSISQLMLRLWVAEESRLGVSRPNGVLQNLWQPLQSHDRGTGRRGRKTADCNMFRLLQPMHLRGDSRGRDSSTNSTSNESVASARCSTPTAAGLVPSSVLSGECTRTSPENTTLTPNLRGGKTSETMDLGSVGEEFDDSSDGGSGSGIALVLQAGRRGGRKGGQGGSHRRGKRTSKVDGEVSVMKAVEQLDLRGKIAAVLGLVGFDVSATDGLGPSDLKASYMAMSYLDFKVGEVWQQVAAELEAQRANPIAADALVLDAMLERAFDRAHEVKSKQTALTVEQGLRDTETEEEFFAAILFQRDQEIRQAIIKRNALMPSTSKRRLAAKHAKEKMFQRSGTRLPSEEGSEIGGIGAGMELSEEGAEVVADDR